MNTTNLNRVLAVSALAVTLLLWAPALQADPAPPTVPPAATAPGKDLPSDVPANHPAAGAVEDLIKKGVVKPAPDSKFHGAQPVTRYELAVVLDKLIDYIEDAHKPIKQTKYPAPSSALTAPVGSAAREAQSRLLLDGFVPISSPLLVAKLGDSPVTASELATILGTVVNRLNDRSIPVTENAAPVN